MPPRIISYHDPRFTSRFWCVSVSAFGCEHAKFLSYYPETDGSERMHKSLEQILGCYANAH